MKINLSKLKKIRPGEPGFVYVLAGIVFLFGLVLLVFFSWNYFGAKFSGSGGTGRDLSLQDDIVKDCNFRRVLDGVCVKTKNEVNPKLVTVMVENHYSARPQSGIASASVVYEAPVEANYTRFMLVYPETVEALKIGPVRSARPYFLDWLQEYGDAMYMHVGGSPDALNLIEENKIFNLNEFYRGWYFWRSEDRSAPHNVYTSSKMWKKALESYDELYEVDEYQGWLFNTSSPNHLTTQPQVTEIIVSFLPPVYEAVWKYNTSTARFARYQMGYPHTDKDGTLIEADTIVVQYVETEVLDEIGRLGMETVGSGEAVVFYNGIDILGRWVKENKTSRTRFYDITGEEIKLKPGKIWVEVVNGRGSVSY